MQISGEKQSNNGTKSTRWAQAEDLMKIFLEGNITMIFLYSYCLTNFQPADLFNDFH